MTEIELKRVVYKSLNAKQKENYNYHKVAAALTEYGYDSMRLNNDWEGADFISVKGDDMIKVQLKGRFTLSKKYENKDLYIAFIEDGIIKIYSHDEALGIATNNITDSKSWLENGSYSMNQTPKHYSQVIKEI